MSAELVARRTAVANPDPATLAELITDISCSHCRKTLRNVTLLEIAWSKPCPLCRTCPECRDLCLTGEITHGMEEAR